MSKLKKSVNDLYEEIIDDDNDDMDTVPNKKRKRYNFRSK